MYSYAVDVSVLEILSNTIAVLLEYLCKHSILIATRVNQPRLFAPGLLLCEIFPPVLGVSSSLASLSEGLGECLLTYGTAHSVVLVFALKRMSYRDTHYNSLHSECQYFFAYRRIFLFTVSHLSDIISPIRFHFYLNSSKGGRL